MADIGTRSTEYIWYLCRYGVLGSWGFYWDRRLLVRERTTPGNELTQRRLHHWETLKNGICTEYKTELPCQRDALLPSLVTESYM